MLWPECGCFCFNTTVELSPHDEKFEILTREHQMYLSVIFEETIERGVSTGELDSNINAKGLAQTLVVSDRSFVDNSMNMILSLLDS
ncbi:hypothetical protein ASF12_04235 [Paenibacillus sp. Leaf72]|nr:hypothetical protein ASF12_04235 [Paenibacillus sp. Leaf72]